MTKGIPLTSGHIALVDDADFDRLSRYRWYLVGRSATKAGYAVRTGECGGSSRVWMHREIAGAEEGEEADHKNRDTLDNRRENLRACTRAENLRNRPRRRSPLAGYRGVVRAGKCFYARLMLDGQTFSRGGYSSAIEAAVAYDALAGEHHGEFAVLNFNKSRDWLMPFPTPPVAVSLPRPGAGRKPNGAAA